MIEKLVPLKLPPGFFHNGTKYEAGGRWYDGNLMRWREGILQPVGGWRRAQANGQDVGSFGSSTKAAILAMLNATDQLVVVGTDSKLQAYDPSATSTTVTDISPSGGAVGISAVWSLDSLNGRLVAYANFKLWEWDGNLANDAVEMTGYPSQVLAGVVVTPEQFVVALGADTNYQRVAWASQGTTDTWTADSENTAGDYDLQTTGQILCARRTKGQTLILTSRDAWAMTYIGGELVYGFRQEGESCGVIGPSAVAATGDTVYWMGPNGFFRYNGYVQEIPCTVAEKVFGELGGGPKGEIFHPVQCFVNELFGEVTWLYPTGTPNNSPNNRYVTYNYRENLWYYGALDRLAGGSVFGDVCMIDSSGLLWQHEYQNDRGTETPYVESGPIELGDGDQLARIQQIVPDGGTIGDCRMYLKTALFPTGTETTNGPYTLANPTSVRLTARQVCVKVEQVNETAFRFGIPRLGVLPSSRR